MKVLIVDDTREKIRKIINCLTDAGVNGASIDVAQCILDAKKFLEEGYYDLLILDVALPDRPENPPLENGGPQLLREIIERGQLRRPKYIVGLTAYPELFDKYSGTFGDHLWTISHFKQDVDDWCDGIRSLAAHIQTISNKGIEREYKYDLCIVTALPDPEFEAVMKLTWNWRKEEAIGDLAEYYVGTVEVDENASLSVVTAVANRMGMVSSAVLVTKMIERFRPRFLAMVGICAGVEGRCELGDILVADPVWDYQSGKKISEDKGFEIDPHQLPIRNALRRRMVSLSQNRELLNAIKEGWPGTKPRSDLQLHVGPVATGSQVLADPEYMKNIMQQQRKLIGIEMEIYGVYAAADESSYPQPHYFSMKGVCDFADSQKNDDYQKYAAYTSAKVLEAFIIENIATLRNIMT